MYNLYLDGERIDDCFDYYDDTFIDPIEVQYKNDIKGEFGKIVIYSGIFIKGCTLNKKAKSGIMLIAFMGIVRNSIKLIRDTKNLIKRKRF